MHHSDGDRTTGHGEAIPAAHAHASPLAHAEPESTLSMTVVVLGYRNAATIVDAVASVCRQAAPDIEVVVVTSGPDSGADAVRLAHPGVRVEEHGPRLMPGGARNAGVALARGRVVAFLAADCIAAPGWVDARRRAHADGHPAVAGSVACAPPHTPWAAAAWLIGYSARLPGFPAGPVAPGSPRRHGLSVERHLLAACGGFDDTLRIGEDTAMADALQERGVGAWFAPAARIEHHGPRNPVQLLLDEHRRGRRLRAHERAELGSTRPTPSLRRLGHLARTKTRRSLAAGWHHGAVPHRRVIAAAPFVLLGVGAQLAGWR